MRTHHPHLNGPRAHTDRPFTTRDEDACDEAVRTALHDYAPAIPCGVQAVALAGDCESHWRGLGGGKVDAQ